MESACDFYLDEVTPALVRGWAWCPDRPQTPCRIVLVLPDGGIAAQTVADAFRGDLRQAGKRGGWCAFSLALPLGLPPATTLQARVQTDCWPLLARLPLAAPEPAASAVRPAFGLADGCGATGFVDEAGPAEARGWIASARPFGPVRSLDLVIDGEVVSSGTADLWRSDVEHLFKGDGRAGFALPIPRACRDGAVHRLDLRWAGEQASLLQAPLAVRLDPAGAANGQPAAPVPEAAPPASLDARPIELSVLVNFHNMPREAERTLASLSRAFQHGVDDLSYEVVAIDNGSTPPLDEGAVTRHGAQFRLFRPSHAHPSPVFAINEAAAQARGRMLAVMIDGAHLLSPGVLAEAMAAMREPARTLVAVRHWFVGGDQRWLSTIGYSGAHEDVAFARIGWPACGYDIFKISAPIHDSPNTWFDSMSESNCLFVSAADWAALGGYGEGFDMPGAGFANLDLFARAAALPGMTVTALVGEASFHQYHGGTTTNVTDAEKEARVRRYAALYQRLRQAPFDAVDRDRLRFRGRVRTDYALNSRQRPSSRVRLGLTTAVRPVPLTRTLDSGAQAYACASYVEAGCHLATQWAGQTTGVAPGDLIDLQQVLWDERPEVLVLVDVAPGLVEFVRSILISLQLEGLRLVWVTATGGATTPAGVTRLVGTPEMPSITTALADLIGTADAVSAVCQPRDDDPAPLEMLRCCARLVTSGGYLVVLGAALGQPVLGYADRWISNTIHSFLEEQPAFRTDRTRNAHIVTTCPGGFLRRVPDPAGAGPYNEELDRLEEKVIA